MLRHWSLIAFTLCVVPAAAGAQRSTAPNIRGERAGDVGGRGFQMPRSSELEDHSSVGVVLDKRKKLSLTDSQVTALKDIAKALHERNADFYRMWDSVRVSMRAASGGAFGGSTMGATGSGRGGDPALARGGDAGGGASPADMERMATARNRMQAIMRPLREGDEWAKLETLKVLSDEQKAKAQQFWKDDAEDFRGGMMGGPGGGRPPGV